jgi:hypothetical protein
MRRVFCDAARRLWFWTAVAMACIPCSTAVAETLLLDDFSAALVRPAPDTYGMGTVASSGNWIGVNGAMNNPPNGNLSVDGGKLTFSPYDNGVNVAGALQGIMTNFTPKTLSNIGDTITLKFDFSFAAQPNTSTSGGAALGAFRFGLYNDQGTKLVDNDGNQDVDDAGYRIGISLIASPSGSRIARENGTDPAAAVGSGSGTGPISDNVYFSPNPGGPLPSAVGTNTHTAIVSVIKTPTTANISFTYDGTPMWTQVDTTNTPYLSFNELAIIQNAIYTGATPPNGTFSIDNVSVDFSLPAVRGDANGDNVVDFLDFSALLAKYQQPGTYADGDFDGSGTVDFIDLSMLLANYQQTVMLSAQITPVPEPSTLVLAAVGAFALPLVFRRRRAKHGS